MPVTRPTTPVTRIERTITVASSVGLHARPAKLVAKAAAQQPARVDIAKEGGEVVDARSLLSLLSLGVEHGDVVVLAAEGDGAQEAVDALAEMLERNLDAE